MKAAWSNDSSGFACWLSRSRYERFVSPWEWRIVYHSDGLRVVGFIYDGPLVARSRWCATVASLRAELGVGDEGAHRAASISQNSDLRCGNGVHVGQRRRTYARPLGTSGTMNVPIGICGTTLICGLASARAPASVENRSMSVDVSPDGRAIVFDLDGHLYTTPITGGRAHRITSGPAVDRDPRWSPDGKLIAFASNRGGFENVWTIDPGTGRVAARTRDSLTRHVVAPAWSADGAEIVFSFAESAPGFEIVQVDGGARQRYLTEPTGSRGERSVAGAVFAADGRSLLIQSVGPRLDDAQLYRYDRLGRQQRAITAEAGGAMRPVLARDGRHLVFATRDDSVTASLKIRDIESGTEHVLARLSLRDRPTASIGPPAYAFTPNGRALVVSANGALWRVNVADGLRRAIPLRVDSGSERRTVSSR